MYLGIMGYRPSLWLIIHNSRVRFFLMKLAGMLYGIYGSAFRFRRPSAVQHHEIPNNVWEVTRPEDHEEVCARTRVPPSGKEEITDLHLPVPASGGVCGTSAAAHQNGKIVQMYRMAVVEHLSPLANGELSPGPGLASTSSVLNST